MARTQQKWATRVFVVAAVVVVVVVNVTAATLLFDFFLHELRTNKCARAVVLIIVMR